MNENRRELLKKLHSAKTLDEQRTLTEALAQMDREATAKAEEDRSVDWADTVIKNRFQPVAVHAMNTTATDWMDELQTTAGADYSNQIHAEASIWYNKVDDEVKADPAEFAEQARGKARLASGQYGDKAEAAEKEFLSYVAFLYKHSASGLDQLHQTFDPHDNYAPTGFDPQVFDNFADPVHPINQWTQEEGNAGPIDSERPSRAQEVGGAQNTIEAPDESEHTTTDDHHLQAENENWPESKPSGPAGSNADPSEHTTDDVKKNSSLVSTSLWDNLEDEDDEDESVNNGRNHWHPRS